MLEYGTIKVTIGLRRTDLPLATRGYAHVNQTLQPWEYGQMMGIRWVYCSIYAMVGLLMLRLSGPSTGKTKDISYVYVNGSRSVLSSN